MNIQILVSLLLLSSPYFTGLPTWKSMAKSKTEARNRSDSMGKSHLIKAMSGLIKNYGFCARNSFYSLNAQEVTVTTSSWF